MCLRQPPSFRQNAPMIACACASPDLFQYGVHPALPPSVSRSGTGERRRAGGSARCRPWRDKNSRALDGALPWPPGAIASHGANLARSSRGGSRHCSSNWARSRAASRSLQSPQVIRLIAIIAMAQHEAAGSRSDSSWPPPPRRAPPPPGERLRKCRIRGGTAEWRRSKAAICSRITSANSGSVPMALA